MFRGWSFPAGRVFGVDVRIHLTFLFLLAFVWFTQSAALGTTGAARGLLLVLIIFGCVVAHELGHALVARHYGLVVRSILLLPIGGMTLMEEPGPEQSNPARDIRIAVAGPLINLVIAAIAAVAVLALAPQVKLWSQPFVFAGNLPRSLVWSNIFLGLFNLLPAYPMDGGRILRALFAERMDYVLATRRAVLIGQGMAMVMILAGLAWNVWLVLIGFFLFLGAQMEDRSVLFHSLLDAVSMEDVMLTGFSVLSPGDTLEDALRKAVHTLQDDFPVVRGSEMVGVINKQRIVESLRREGNGYVQSAMMRSFEIAQRTDSVGQGFRKLGTRGLTMIPVVDDLRLVGIVTLQNLSHSVALLLEGRRLRRIQQ
ncbi:MAG: site-2 protease family protein [Candidatus Korobacteraceae bacterium]